MRDRDKKHGVQQVTDVYWTPRGDLVYLAGKDVEKLGPFHAENYIRIR